MARWPWEREVSRPRPREAGAAVRIGAPKPGIADLYFWLLQGSWLRVGVFLATGFILANIIFAFLYTRQDHAVTGLEPGDWIGAFSFSVQTMATIGYGVMSPRSPWAHLLVTLEVMSGLIGVAFATSLVIARVSRPNANVMFSEIAVITTHEGKPTLMFRMANARGNEIVEASVRLAALVDNVTSDGHRMRRIVDLPLHRSSTPMFALSWTVMHTITPESPLAAVTESDAGAFKGLVITMTGLDNIYAQTVHARNIYRHEQLRWAHRFVDVMTTLPDGRLQIDYRNFHLTEPDPESPSRA